MFVSKIISQMLGVSAKCRHNLSCSEYAKRSIGKHGIVIGGYRSIRRILSCQPFVNSKLKSQRSKAKLKTQKFLTLRNNFAF
ncbi:MAG: hypothetical protein A2770_00995 [Candidatus Levybacteria bacterium RIFCSPHIGHO2_01_FULL_38_12]|nr:MAG: hypothetical protein A2770_00995 [Candidatus Levybacteria bacterium RIFCSPHIGHO2_01_FULL_38_12]